MSPLKNIEEVIGNIGTRRTAALRLVVDHPWPASIGPWSAASFALGALFLNEATKSQDSPPAQWARFPTANLSLTSVGF